MVRWAYLRHSGSKAAWLLLVTACARSNGSSGNDAGTGAIAGGAGAGSSTTGGDAGRSPSAGGARGGGAGTSGSAGSSPGNGGLADAGGRAATAGASSGGDAGERANGGAPSGGHAEAGNGNGGSTPCTIGGACAPDGDTCQDTTCCALIYTCKGGIWDAPVESCPRQCPTAVPTEGDPCDNCTIECGYGQCDTAGKNQTYFAVCRDDFTWRITVNECDPQCCTQNDECQSGRCARTRCVSALSPPTVSVGRACWEDTDCESAQFCFGSQVCPCDQTCDYGSTMGQCLPAGSGCCTADADCDSAQTCISGICQAQPDPGRCWSNADCPTQFCQGGTRCLCGRDCTGATPGQCMNF